MSVDRTEIEWIYTPADYLEAPYRHSADEFEIVIDAGKAIATLSTPQDPVPEDLEARVRGAIEGAFLVRQLQLHKAFHLGGLQTYQHSGGRKNVAIMLGSASAVFIAGQVDTLVTDAAGNVVSDSKAERIAEHTSMLDTVAPKLLSSSVLRGMFESYSRAVTDPDDELVHLYEIRDALSRHYGGETAARDALGIGKPDWQRLGLLANVEPIEQGRHRGQHTTGRRAATSEELHEARALVLRWIVAFAKTV